MKSPKSVLAVCVTATLSSGLIAAPPAMATATSFPGVVSGDWVNHDFTALDLQPVNNVVTVDTTFVGALTITPGTNDARTVLDGGSKALKLEATTGIMTAYKGTINRAARTGIDTRVKFSDTISQRNLFEVRSMTTPTGNGSWPTLLKFDASGNIRDSTGTVLRQYAANEWYDLTIDLDSPNHKYSAWLNGEPLITDLDLGNYTGIMQNKIQQLPNAAQTPSRMYFAHLRAGTIVPALESFTLPDGTAEVGEAHYPIPMASPVGAFVEGFTFTSSNEGVVRPFGMSLLARDTGTATITATETWSGKTATFQLTVTDPVRPRTAHSISKVDLTALLQLGSRPQVDWTAAQINANWPLAQSYLEMSDSAFIAAVQADSATINEIGGNRKFGTYARVFAMLYSLTGDKAYAKRSLQIMYYYGVDFGRILSQNVPGNLTAVSLGDFPFAFATLIDSDVWDLLEPTVSAGDLKQLIREVLIRRFMNECLDTLGADGSYGNLDPYCARPAAVSALILTDPALVRRVITFHDGILTPQYFNADGFWHEETGTYSDQTTNNIATAIDVIKSYVDPAGYNDTALGLTLDHTDLTSRWPLLTKSRNILTEQLLYPDGTYIPTNDTDPARTGSPLPMPIVENGLKPIAMGNTGYYRLLQGDTTDATHIGLFTPKSGRYGSGHHHVNFNGIDLWGAGVELLARMGYVRGTTYADGSGGNLRFPTMSPVWGNTPWVWRADDANIPSQDWVRPAVLAYDDGSANGKQVQLVETSSLGAAGKGAEINRRMEVMVNLGGNRNYVFDLTRLKGGDGHEIRQRGAELEAMSVQTNGITMNETGQPNLDAYLQSINSTKGYAKYRNWMLNPKAGDGSTGFDFTWTGKESGAAVHTFMNGVPGSDVFMSELPRARTIKTKADETKLVTPQVTRRTIVGSPDQITRYGAVYEATGQGQTSLVNGVEWVAPADGDPMTTIAIVRSGNYKDIIYSSNDRTERTVSGITFSGGVALARTDAATGELLWSYVYGEGKVTAGLDTITGVPTQKLKITGATTSSMNTALDPDTARKDTITVAGSFSDPGALVGERVLTKFADGSGFSQKVLGVEQQGDSTVLTVESFTPFRLVDGGVELPSRPTVTIPGDAYVVFDQSVSGVPDRTAPDAPAITSPKANGVTTQTPTVSGTAEAGSTVTITIDGSQVGTTTTAPDGRWSFTVTEEIAFGKHHATATATDRAGNVSAASAQVKFTVGITTGNREPMAIDHRS